jgi:hypothetical protein
LPLAIRKPLNSKELLFIGYILDEAGFSLDFSVMFQILVRSSGSTLKKKEISLQIMMSISGNSNINDEKVKKYLEDYTNKIWNLDVYWGDSLTFSRELRQQLS